MSDKEGLLLAKQVVKHSVTYEAELTVVRRECDTCDELTPLPTREQLDHATLMANTNGVGNVVPCIADGFEGLSPESGYAPYGRNLLFRPEGWLLFGKKWTCPKCVERITKAMEGKKC